MKPKYKIGDVVETEYGRAVITKVEMVKRTAECSGGPYYRFTVVIPFNPGDTIMNSGFASCYKVGARVGDWEELVSPYKEPKPPKAPKPPPPPKERKVTYRRPEVATAARVLGELGYTVHRIFRDRRKDNYRVKIITDKEVTQPHARKLLVALPAGVTCKPYHGGKVAYPYDQEGIVIRIPVSKR